MIRVWRMPLSVQVKTTRSSNVLTLCNASSFSYGNLNSATLVRTCLIILSVVILLKQCTCDVRQNQQINQPILINFIILWLMCMYSLLPAWLCFFAFIYFCHLGGQWIFEVMGLKNSSCIYFTIRIYSMKYSVFHNDVCKNQIKWQNEELGSIYKLFYTDFTPPRSLTSADHQRLSVCRNIQWFICVSQSKSSRKIEQRGRIFTFN